MQREHLVRLPFEEIKTGDCIYVKGIDYKLFVIGKDEIRNIKILLVNFNGGERRAFDYDDYIGSPRQSIICSEVELDENYPSINTDTWTLCELYYGIGYYGYSDPDPIRQIALLALKGDAQAIDVIKDGMRNG